MDVHNDTNKRRDRARADKKLYRRYIKGDAVGLLSIFPNEYLSTAGSCRRTTVKATSAGRRQEEADAMQQPEETFMAEGDIAGVSIAYIADSLQREATTPEGFTISVIDQTLLIYLLQVNDDVPQIRANLVKTDRSVCGAEYGRQDDSVFSV